MKTLVRSSLKLLFRTKAFWFFLIIMPVLSTFILKVRIESSLAYQNSFAEEVIELESPESKVAYSGGKGEFVVKVYDAAADECSDAFLSRLAASGLFLICRADISDVKDPDGFVEERIDIDGFQDRMGAVIYIHADMKDKAEAGDASDPVVLYVLSDDDRVEALKSEMKLLISTMNEYDSFDMPEKNVVTVAGNKGRNLTMKQTNQKTQVGYAFAFMTLCFVFCGIFVAHAAIREQKDGVYTRIRLTRTTTTKYFLSKFIVSFIISVMITGVLGLCSLVLSPEEIGMGRPQFLAMIFMMGLIFSSLSMLIGILMGDVMSANVAAFTLWCMSALLSGLYFPLNYTSTFLKVVSFMMPQKWFLEGTEMIFVADNGALSMLLCITGAYLAVILSLGGLGLKLRRNTTWENS